MQSAEEKKAYDDVVFKACFSSNLIYLLTHIAYFIFFILTKLYVMAYINIGSITIYLTFMLLIKFKKYSLYALGCGVEISAYMTVATVLCGFGAGFHLCLIGLCVISFFASYFSKKESHMVVPIIWNSIMLIEYLFLYFWWKFGDVYYELNTVVASILFVAHTVVVFSFITGFLYVFGRYSFKLENQIRQESRIDRLTHIPNRYALYNYLDTLENKAEYVLTIFDIDDFKKINDKNGHICGDYMLREIANIAYGNLFDGFVARYGGEEFIIISKIETDIEATADKVDKIRRMVADYDFTFDGKRIHSTITMGIAKYEDGLTNDEWISLADNKLYDGKKSGKNKTVF